MVSKARLDLPEPDTPVNTTNWFLGISNDTFLRLCWRAPRIFMVSALGFDMTRYCKLIFILQQDVWAVLFLIVECAPRPLGRSYPQQ